MIQRGSVTRWSRGVRRHAGSLSGFASARALRRRTTNPKRLASRRPRRDGFVSVKVRPCSFWGEATGRCPRRAHLRRMVGYRSSSDATNQAPDQGGKGAVRPCARRLECRHRRCGHRLRQRSCHLDPARRQGRDRGNPRGVRASCRSPADQRHQIHDRPHDWRGGIGRGDLLPAGAA